MAKWEYRDVIYDTDYVKEDFNEWLNSYGQLGWELVSIYYPNSPYSNSPRCIFKRKIE